LDAARGGFDRNFAFVDAVPLSLCTKLFFRLPFFHGDFLIHMT
jgi:hypothetical protein